MKESFKIIIYMVMVYINGTMGENIMESGKTTKWKAKGNYNGQMESHMKGNICKIISMVKGYFHG